MYDVHVDYFPDLYFDSANYPFTGELWFGPSGVGIGYYMSAGSTSLVQPSWWFPGALYNWDIFAQFGPPTSPDETRFSPFVCVLTPGNFYGILQISSNDIAHGGFATYRTGPAGAPGEWKVDGTDLYICQSGFQWWNVSDGAQFGRP